MDADYGGQQALVNSRAALDAERTALALSPLHLYKDGFGPTPENVEADFAAQECDFTGYATVALSWSVVGVNSAGVPEIVSTRAFFQFTPATTPNTVGGCWVQKVGAEVAYYVPFTAPIPLALDGQMIAVTLKLSADGTIQADVEF